MSVEGGLPTGTVTFLFTDLEGSTRLWEERPEAMRDALARHDELLRDVVESRGGCVVKATGDGFHAAFPTARDALGAAVAGQRGLAEAPWGSTGPLRVRMGIHTGEAQLRGGDYFGSALNRAARLTAVAHGGQIVCSQATADLVRDGLPEGVGLVDLGEHRLRDLSRAERVFQANAPGLRREFAPLVSLDAFPGNLPLQVSSFIGRERELSRIATALGEARMVTLTGVGGVGKTRLALQAAADALPRFREGTWFCELAAVRDPDGVVDALAAVFAVTPRAGRTVEESLVEFFGTKQLLLVVDNCEHLLEAVADLVELVERSCPGVVILATSREGLALDGERVLPVPSLPGPPADAGFEAVARAEAVHLFIERARAVDPDLSLTAHNAAAVAQVCRRLDGVPLAIELAAARVAAMNPAELARGLDRRFETLAGGRRRAVQRHQTLRAAIDWSYDLLSAPEQRLLARLAVFAGGCTRAAVEGVCAGEPIDAARVFDLLSGLVVRSLVVAERDRPETRYRLLETIREYAEGRLAAHGETEALRDRHAEYYAGFACSVSAEIFGPQQAEAGRRLLADYENLVAALNHAIDANNVNLALNILRDMPPWGVQTAYFVMLPVDRILQLPGASEHPLYAFGLAVAGHQAAMGGDRQTAERRSTEAFDAAQRLGTDRDHEVDYVVSNARLVVAYAAGALLDAADESERCAELARAAGRDDRVGVMLGSAAMFCTMAGSHERAVRLATEGLAVARRSGSRLTIAVCLTALAGGLADRDREQACAVLRESLELWNTPNYEGWEEISQASLISAHLEEWDLALDLAVRSIRSLHWFGDRPVLGAMFNVVARVLAPSAPKAAAVIQGAAYTLATTAITTPGPTRSSPASSNSGPSSEPANATTFVTDLRRQTTGLLLDSLGDQRLDELRAQGKAMNSDEAAAYVLDAITHTQHDAQITNQRFGVTER
jgi:predicted ATPase/class 3 adenylate cyclase